jgi:deoxyribonuclease IV
MADCCCTADAAQPSKPKVTLRVVKPGCRCGGQVSLLSTLYETVSQNPECRCLQMFLGNPQSYDCRTISPVDKEMTRDYCALHNKTFYVHCSLLANLAKPDSRKSVEMVSKALDAVSGLPAAAVLHIGKVGTIETVAQHINDIQRMGHLPLSQHARVPFHLLLEVAAGQGTELGRNWHEIRKLYEALDYTRVGLCIDTQHAFASGMCSFQTHEDVVKLFDAGQAIARRGISMIHLNDSLKEYQSQVDRHAPLRQGFIWARSDEGLRSLLNISRSQGLDLISETPDPASDIRLVNRYMAESQQ